MFQTRRKNNGRVNLNPNPSRPGSHIGGKAKFNPSTTRSAPYVKLVNNKKRSRQIQIWNHIDQDF